MSSARLYIDSSKVEEEVRKHLGNDVELRPYDSIFSNLQALSDKKQVRNSMFDVATAN